MKKYSAIILTIFIICFGFNIFSAFRSFDPDLWGHLRFGEYIILNGIPFKDVFSYVLTKPIWVNHEWLSEVIFYHFASFNSNGIFLLLLKAICFIIIILIPWVYIIKINKDKNPVILLLIFLLAIMVLSYGTAIRPQMFTYLFFSLTLFFLEKYGLRSGVTLFFLPIIFIFWVNCHGGVIAGMALVGFYSLFELSKLFYNSVKSKENKISMNECLKILLLPFLLILTLFITPFSINYIPYITDAILMNRPFVDEWQSILVVKINYLFIYILLVVATIVIIDSINKINSDKLYKIILLVLFMIISVLHTRHFPFFAIVCAYFLPVLIIDNNLSQPIIANTGTNNLYKNLAIVSLMFLTILSGFLIHHSLFAKQKFNMDPKVLAKMDPQIVAKINKKKDEYVFNYKITINLLTNNQYVGFPMETMDFIKANQIRGNMLADFNWGEFVIYSLYPSVKVAMDGRYETVYPQQSVEDYENVIKAKPGWKKILDRNNTTLLLVSKYEPLSQKLFNDPDWKLAFQDMEAFLFYKVKK